MRINIRVVPNAKRDRIVEEASRTKVYLTAPPNEGRANRALIEFLARHFKVKKSAVSIIRGHASRQKAVEIILPPKT